MKQTNCEYERSIIKEFTVFGELSGDATAHVARCNDCREALTIARWMQAFAATATPQPAHLPAPGLLWWKSQLIKKQEAVSRATQPILFTQIAACIIAASTLMWWLMKNLTQLDEQLTPIFSGLLKAIEPIAAPLLIGFACSALVCATLLFTLRRFLTED